MRMILRKCCCKTWERHLESEKCKVDYCVDGLFNSYEGWDRDFADKWQFEYDPEDYFLIPEESEIEEDQNELAIAAGNLSIGKEHPLFKRAMDYMLDEEEDEIICQLLFDEKKPIEIARDLGMTKLAVLQRISIATKRIQSFFRRKHEWVDRAWIAALNDPHLEISLSKAA